MKSASSNLEMKKKVGIAAADYVKQGMVVGIGTGSTMAFMVEELGRRVALGLVIQGVATSFQSRILCHKAGIPLTDPGLLDHLDLAVDGADEVDRALDAIKGGGAAHTLEKIVAQMAEEYILIIDGSKKVEQLGLAFPIPVDVLPSALGLVLKEVQEMGGDPRLRMAVKKDGPVVTDNGHFLIDIYFSQAPDVYSIEKKLQSTPGVVGSGLFLGLADKILVAGTDGVETLVRISDKHME